MKFNDDNFIYVDLETDSLNPFTCKIVRVGYLFKGFYFSKHSYYDLDEKMLGESGTASWVSLNVFLSIPTRAKVFHNAAFDMQVLHAKGYAVEGEIHDTMLLAKAWRNDLPSYGLKQLAYYIFGDPCLADGAMDRWFKQRGLPLGDRDMSKPPAHLVAQYCKADVKMTRRLFRWLYPKVQRDPGMRRLYDLERETLLELMRIERQPIYVDRAFCLQRAKASKKRADALEKEIGFNPRSSKQMTAYLKENVEVTSTTATGLASSDEATLKRYQARERNPTLAKVIEIRELRGEISRHVTNLMEVTSNDKPYFFPRFRQSEAITRRFSAAGFLGADGQVTPGNMQNFPRRKAGAWIRGGIVPPEGYLIAKVDLSQIEPRLLAHLIEIRLKDSRFADEYRRNPGYNIYLDVAWLCTDKHQKKGTRIYDQYKETVLARCYGSGIERTAESLEIPFAEAHTLRQRIDMHAPQFKAIQSLMMTRARRAGFVEDDFGARCYVSRDMSYKAVNYYCQPCAGNVFKWWLVALGKYLREWESPDYIWNLLHDECDMYVRKDGSRLTRLKDYCSLLAPLEKLFGLPITADFKTGKNWKECG